MTWVVFWMLMQIAPCPQPGPDIYGRASFAMTTQACWSHTQKSTHFDNEKDARAFMEQGKKNCSECSGWELKEEK